jgi:hypothetical protein
MIMYEKYAWIYARQTMDNVHGFVVNYVRPISRGSSNTNSSTLCHSQDLRGLVRLWMRESRALTSTWSRPLAHVCGGP